MDDSVVVKLLYMQQLREKGMLVFLLFLVCLSLLPSP